MENDYKFFLFYVLDTSNKMDVQSMQIQQNQTYSHKILPIDCIICQMDTFLFDDNGRGKTLPKDLKHLLYHEVIQSAKEVFTFDYRFAAADELAFGDELTEEFPDLCHGLYPVDSEQHDGKKIRIVFVGEEEACLGFLFGLVYRFGALTILCDGLDIGLSPLNAKITQRFANAINGGCVFNQVPEAAWRISAEMMPEEGIAHFAAVNIEKCYSGFKKLLDLKIDGVCPREFIAYKSEKKLANHPAGCDFCEDEQVEEVEIGELPECKAYWYFIDDY